MNSGHEQAADAGLGLFFALEVGQLSVIRTPCVAISVVSSVALALSTSL